jgi:hypothetical protein
LQNPSVHPICMQPKQCDGTLTIAESETLEEKRDLRLYTCAACGKRNLYLVKDPEGKWALEPHRVPMPRLLSGDSAT